MMSNLSKRRFPVYLLMVSAIGVLSVYVWKVTQYPLSKESPRGQSCLKDGDPVIRAIIDASPTPFLSRFSKFPKEAFSWWRSIQLTSQDFEYFTKTVDRLFQIFPPYPNVVEPDPGLCRTCAVVGNSGNLAGSHYGPLIDVHNTVIRINRGQTKGYEEHVGTKTTHHVMYPESAVNLVNTTHLVFFPFKIKDLEWLLQSFDPADSNRKSQRRGNKDLVMILNPAFMKYVHDVWLQQKGRYPSTGFMVVILSLVICDKVSVFGFGADRDGNWNHYYEKFTYKNLKTGPHPGMVEHEIIEDLHEEKMIRFYKGF